MTCSVHACVACVGSAGVLDLFLLATGGGFREIWVYRLPRASAGICGGSVRQQIVAMACDIGRESRYACHVNCSTADRARNIRKRCKHGRGREK